MSTLTIILLILAGAAMLWQAILVAGWVAMLASGKYSKVRVGLTPGVVGVVLLIAAVLV